MAVSARANIDTSGLRRFAVIGAEARLLEIAKEAAAIYRAFPELRDRGIGSPGAAGATSTARSAGRRGRHMRSAAQRQAARERMQRYWAERRKGGTRKQARTARPRRGARTMSASARKRISEAQKARWAKLKSAGSKKA